MTSRRQISRKGFAECRNPGDHERLRLIRYDGRYDERDPTGCETIWRSGVEKRTKAEDERRTEHEEEERMKKDEMRVKNACFSTRVVGTLVPSSRELKLTHRHSALRVQLKAVGATLHNQPEKGHCFWSKRCHSRRCDLRGTHTPYQSGHSKSAHSLDWR
jgi:hypothetical protein